ncbi:Ribokinase-like protein [Paraphoma chrysanthemicola]|uniref:Ribokinase-like protein n=1 Tax=Paraphoma chrysanthemicola TaxID=798071 RepID=A0A8K0VZ76_9PLEO|nr:Ribokinase-like protein [Paraphoma chrysanthemicola]
MSRSQPIEFVSLGMLVLDEIRIPGHPALTNVVGGSGAFSTLGFRIFHPSPSSYKVGCLVLAGADFPDQVQEELEKWEVTLLVKKDAEKLSTRGLLEYHDDTFGPKTFTYTNPPLKPSPEDLIDTPFLAAKVFHILATPEEIISQVPRLLDLRAQHDIPGQPFIIWEPLPSSCVPANLTAMRQACAHVDVFSPNHIELGNLFDTAQASAFNRGEIESLAYDFTISTNLVNNAIMIVRCAEHGSLTITTSCESNSTTHMPLWLPSFHAAGSNRVVDTTGGGNAFLGGFAVGWVETGDVTMASVYGHVAASFVVEQIGMPRVEREEDGHRVSEGSVEVVEVWNGVSVKDRLREYLGRTENGSE